MKIEIEIKDEEFIFSHTFSDGRIDGSMPLCPESFMVAAKVLGLIHNFQSDSLNSSVDNARIKALARAQGINLED